MAGLFQNIVKVFIHNKRFGRHFSYVLFLSVLTISIIGAVFVYSASNLSKETIFYGFFLKQITWYLISFLIIIPTCMIFGYEGLKNKAYLFYIIVILSLIAVLFFGKFAGGSKRWINLGIVNFQPSEFAKIGIIILLANIYSESLSEKGLSFAELIKPMVLVFVPVVLVLEQPDLGTALLFIIIAASMTFFVKIKKKTFLLLLFWCCCLLPFLWYFFLEDYQKARVLTFLFPNRDPLGSSYQIIQSKIAIGSGMLTGKGFLNGTQKALSFLPEQHTDFIWSVIAEETGFLGTSFVLLCFITFFGAGLDISYNCQDDFGAILAFGLVSMLFWQFFINVCMVIGLMPIVGMALPFLSYGGSSVITNMLAVGILLSISMRRFDKAG